MLIYVAGPFSKGDVSTNIQRAIEVGEYIVALGHAPHVPHLTHLWNLISPHPYEYWMKIDFGILRKCNAVFRIDGESPGADREVELAKELDIPVFYSRKELYAWIKTKQDLLMS